MREWSGNAESTLKIQSTGNDVNVEEEEWGVLVKDAKNEDVKELG